MVEKEVSSILNSVLALKKDKALTKSYAIDSLKKLVNRLHALQKQLDERYSEEEQIHQTTKKRLVHLNDATTTNDKDNEIVYYETRINRLITDYLLRENCNMTAQKMIKEYNLEVKFTLLRLCQFHLLTYKGPDSF